MAVYTEVTEDQAQALADSLQLGELRALQGIQGGIENTNYFLTTEAGEYVLTLFERLQHEQLPFYLYRAFHAMPDLRAVPGDPNSAATGAIRGMINMMQSLRREIPAAYAACVFDAKGPTFSTPGTLSTASPTSVW